MRDPRSYLIFPLDVSSFDQAMALVRRLTDHVGLFKVGLELFISEGPRILAAIRAAGNAGIFLDLKLHDIPVTVMRAFLAASAHGPDFVTVHCDEGDNVLRDVAQQNPGNTRILAITVLTSLNTAKLEAMGYDARYAHDIAALALLKARLAKAAGCHGVVCSGHEVGPIKREFGPDLITVVPGIRPAWSVVAQDDQQRIVTPAAAVRQGADYIVVGRPIRDASRPEEAARKVVEEIATVI